jgi:hypothetical protein
MRYVLIIALLCSGGPVAAGEFEGLAASIIAMSNAVRVKPVTPVNPTPVNGVCPDCDGRGKVGDGRTMLTCGTCDGTGKVKSGDGYVTHFPKTAETLVEESTGFAPRYPLNNRRWSGCGSWQHLASGPHAGKFDPQWLAGLSWAELQSLHSDDHEGRTQWVYVVRGNGTASRTATPQGSQRAASGCPPGGCPTQPARRGLFRFR